MIMTTSQAITVDDRPPTDRELGPLGVKLKEAGLHLVDEEPKEGDVTVDGVALASTELGVSPEEAAVASAGVGIDVARGRVDGYRDAFHKGAVEGMEQLDKRGRKIGNRAKGKRSANTTKEPKPFVPRPPSEASVTTTKGLGGPSKRRRSPKPLLASDDVSTDAARFVRAQEALIELHEELWALRDEQEILYAEYLEAVSRNCAMQMEVIKKLQEVDIVHAGEVFLVPTRLGGVKASQLRKARERAQAVGAEGRAKVLANRG